MKTENILPYLNQFTGTEQYHRVNSIFPRILATDGAMSAGDVCSAYWLLDLIASHQPKIGKKFGKHGVEFQNWTLKKNKKNSGAVVTCDDGNGVILAKQKIPFTDFPLDEFSMYCNLAELDSQNRPIMVIMLPSEY